MFNMELLDIKDFNYVSNVDQLNRLYEAKKSLEDVENGLKNDLPIDMIEIDLKNIWNILKLLEKLIQMNYLIIYLEIFV